MPTRYPKRGDQVIGPCIQCKRIPEKGETYGPHREGWDFQDICPRCWDEITAEPEEEDDYGIDEPAF